MDDYFVSHWWSLIESTLPRGRGSESATSSSSAGGATAEVAEARAVHSEAAAGTTVCAPNEDDGHQVSDREMAEVEVPVSRRRGNGRWWNLGRPLT